MRELRVGSILNKNAELSPRLHVSEELVRQLQRKLKAFDEPEKNHEQLKDEFQKALQRKVLPE